MKSVARVRIRGRLARSAQMNHSFSSVSHPSSLSSFTITAYMPPATLTVPGGTMAKPLMRKISRGVSTRPGSAARATPAPLVPVVENDDVIVISSDEDDAPPPPKARRVDARGNQSTPTMGTDGLQEVRTSTSSRSFFIRLTGISFAGCWSSTGRTQGSDFTECRIEAS